MKKTLYLFCTLLITACSSGARYDSRQFIGEWHEVMPANKEILQGFELKGEGRASSVGMATLLYHNWELLRRDDNGYNLLLSGESIGNGQIILFSDTLNVVSLKDDTLTLSKGEMYRIRYVKYDRTRMTGESGDGMRLLSAVDSNAAAACYALFLQDSSEAELFMPGGSIILERHSGTEGTPVWNSSDDDPYILESSEREWLVSRRGKVLYSSSGMENIIAADFSGKNGETLSALFFTEAGIVQIFYEGANHILRQYVTASGYGYSNPLFDMRGKGSEMTLTELDSGKEYNFTEK